LNYESWEKNTDWDVRVPNYKFEEGRDIETIGMSKNPFMKFFIYPRMFVLNSGGDGCELMTQEQVDQVIKHS
jgi:hypothetical protein